MAPLAKKAKSAKKGQKRVIFRKSKGGTLWGPKRVKMALFGQKGHFWQNDQYWPARMGVWGLPKPHLAKKPQKPQKPQEHRNGTFDGQNRLSGGVQNDPFWPCWPEGPKGVISGCRGPFTIARTHDTGPLLARVAQRAQERKGQKGSFWVILAKWAKYNPPNRHSSRPL